MVIFDTSSLEALGYTILRGTRAVHNEIEGKLVYYFHF